MTFSSMHFQGCLTLKTYLIVYFTVNGAIFFYRDYYTVLTPERAIGVFYICDVLARSQNSLEVLDCLAF